MGGKVIAALLCFSSTVFSKDFPTKDEIKHIIRIEAEKQGLDPNVALAIATIESNLNPHAIGPKGEIGLFQIYRPNTSRPRVSQKTRGTGETVQRNIRAGIRELNYWKTYCPVRAGFEWITCYNQGFRRPRFPTRLPYYRRFIRQYMLLSTHSEPTLVCRR